MKLQTVYELIHRQFARLVLAWSVLCALMLIAAMSLGAHHGLMRTIIGRPDYRPSYVWPWPFFDGADYDYWDFEGGAHGVEMAGFVWQGGPGQTTWRIIHGGGVTVLIGGQVVYQVAGNEPLAAHDFPVTWEGDWISIEVEYPHGPRPGAGRDRLEVGIYERTALGGWRLLPAERLYPQVPDPVLARREVLRANLAWLAGYGLLIGLAALLVGWVRKNHLWRRREAQAILAIVVLALIVRLVVVAELASTNLGFYYLPPGSDNYVLMARQLLAGQAGLEGAYFNPGNVVWMAVLIDLVGPFILNLSIANAVLGALSVGAIAGAGWLAFGRRAGVLGGLIGALAWPLVSYNISLFSQGSLSILGAFVIVAGMWVIVKPSLRGAVLFGVLTGLTVLVRPNSVFFDLALLLAMVAARSSTGMKYGWKQIAGVFAAALVFTLLMIVPQTVANWSVGQNDFVSSNGPENLYNGNNRDSSGMHDWYRDALYLVRFYRGERYVEATLEDVKADPFRAATLLFRKVGLFWSNREYKDDSDYVAYQPPTEWTYKILSLGGLMAMSGLTWLGLGGLALLLLDPAARRAPSTWLLIWSIVLGMATIVVLKASGGYRSPLLPVLCVAGGVLIDRTIGAVQTRRLDRKLLGALGIALVLIGVMRGFEDYLPPKRFFYGEVPASTIRRADIFNSQVELLGHAPIESSYQPGGYAYVTLHWQALASMPRDYWVSVQLLDPKGERIAWRDAALGSISYPTVGTSHWPVGAKLTEGYLLKIPADAPPVIDIYVDLYDPDTKGRLPITAPDGAPTSESRVRIGRLGLVTASGVPALQGTVADADFTLGGVLHVTGFSLPETVSGASDLPVGVRLEAAQQVYEDYILFFHLLDADGQGVAQSDSPVLVGDWTTAALVPGVPLGAQRVVDLPDNLPVGKYRLMMGMYSYPSMERLPARTGQGDLLPDGLIEVGWVEVVNK